jgi:hypothetical protein
VRFWLKGYQVLTWEFSVLYFWSSSCVRISLYLQKKVETKISFLLWYKCDYITQIHLHSITITSVATRLFHEASPFPYHELLLAANPTQNSLSFKNKVEQPSSENKCNWNHKTWLGNGDYINCKRINIGLWKQPALELRAKDFSVDTPCAVVHPPSIVWLPRKSKSIFK